MRHFLSILFLSVAMPAFGAEGHDHGKSHSHDFTVPDSLPELTNLIGTKKAELAAALAARNAASAHAATDILSACVKAIPPLLDSGDEAARQRVAGMANNAAKAWTLTAREADSGDFEKATRESAKAEAAYGLIEARLKELAGQPGN